jgi:hypothetical protein
MRADYYTYVYCDPRKKGSFTYGEYTFTEEPFYVGKGTLDRWRMHTWPSKLKKERNPKAHKIRKILREGLKPSVVFPLENATEPEALAKEIELIRLIGRADLQLGPLANLTDGGDSPTLNMSPSILRENAKRLREHPTFTGRKHLEETRKKISESRLGIEAWNKGKGEYLSNDARNRTKAGQRVWLDKGNRTEFSAEAREKIRASKLGGNNPMAVAWVVTCNKTGETFRFTGGLKRFFIERGTTIDRVKGKNPDGWEFRKE